MKYLLVVLLSFLSISTLSGFDKERAVLTQQMLDSANGSFVVDRDYTLKGERLISPKGLSLIFRRGSIDKGELVGNNTSIKVLTDKSVFGLEVIISGTWNVAEAHDGWFAFDYSPEFISNQLIKNMLAFSNDATRCHLFFEEERTYYFELPYKGKTNLGDMVSLRKENGEYKRNYIEIDGDDYSFLRIFTIPSNTHLTINNTLKMLPTNQGAYFIFWELGKENVIVDGNGTISGDNDWHRYETPFAGKKYYGEWGFIFRCFRCHNFTFKDITLSDAFGDCIIYSGSFLPSDSNPRWASYLTIDNVKILRARRNGIAIGARNVKIIGCHFEGCGTKDVKGTLPRSGIDFEPDFVSTYPEIGNQDVLMERCTFKDNYYDVASYNNNLRNYGKIATVIRNCKFSSKIKIQATNWMRFENCYIPFIYNKKSKKSMMLYCKHMEFDNCDFGQYDISALSLAANVTNKYTNCRFNVDNKKDN